MKGKETTLSNGFNRGINWFIFRQQLKSCNRNEICALFCVFTGRIQRAEASRAAASEWALL